MTTIEIISLLINVLLTGGGIVAIVTLRATKQKANAEAVQATAEAQGSTLDNDEKAAKIMLEYIVEPLKKEINALRKDVRKLQKAVDKVSVCPHSADCPVRVELQKQQSNDDGNSENN